MSCKQTRESVLRQWQSTPLAAPSGFYLLIALLHHCALVSECVEFLSLHLPWWQSWAWVIQHNLGTSLHGSWWVWHSPETLPGSWGLCRLWASPASEASSGAAVWGQHQLPSCEERQEFAWASLVSSKTVRAPGRGIEIQGAMLHQWKTEKMWCE